MSERKIISINAPPPDAPKKKPPSRRKIFVFAALLVLAALVLSVVFLDEELNLDKVRRFFTYFGVSSRENYGEYSFESNSVNTYVNFDGGLAVASQNGLATYADHGGQVGLCQTSLSVPAVGAADGFAIAFDVGGSSIVALDQTGQTCLQMKAEGTLLDLDVARSGYFVYAMTGDPYKTVLAVLNTSQQEIYRWNSSTQYLNCCAVSDNGKFVAAVGLGQTDTAFASTALILRTDQTEPYAQIPLGNRVIYDLHFFDNGNLCAVGEDAVLVFDVDGKMVGEFPYDGNQLSDYSMDGGGVALCMHQSMQGGGYALISLDNHGQVLGRQEQSGAVQSISVCKKYIAALSAGELTVYNRELELYWAVADIASANRVLMRDDGTAIVLGAGGGRLWIPD